MAEYLVFTIGLACLFYVLSATPEFVFPPENKVRVQINWPGTSLSKENEEQGNIVYMTSVDHERYKCVLPSEDGNDEENQNDSDKYKGESPLQLLKPIFSQMICALKIESFWVYELCHGHYIRQFHEDNSGHGKVRLQFFLGKFDIDAAFAEERARGDDENESLNLPTIQVEDAQLPYFAINMTDGTFCEISGKKRFTRVLYVCNQKRNSNIIFSLKETSSCEYEIIVLTSVLCVHPAFKKKYFSDTAVYCHPIDSSPTVPRRLEKLENSMKLEMFKPFLGTATLEDDAKKVDDSSKDKPIKFKEDVKKLQERAKIAKEKVRDIATIKISQKKDDPPHDDKLIDDVLQGRYCLRGGSSWWRYEFCYGKQVKQYHINDDGSKTTVVLGYWDVQKHMKWLEAHPSKKPKKGEETKQISHYYFDGEYCEEAKKPREVEVKLRCKTNLGHPDSVSLYLMEPKTCEYILTVESPVFCYMLKKHDENGLTSELLSSS